MRDIARLDKFYEELKDIHKKSFGQWRFGQLMFNFLSECGDPFYLEEDAFITKMKEYANKNSPYYHWDIS